MKFKPFLYIAGYAGTGKTVLAKHLAGLFDQHVLYMAYTGKAAMVMRKNGCEGASTIHSTIFHADKNLGTGEVEFKLHHRSVFDNVGLFIIDECSMVDEELGRQILSFGVPVLVLGDPGQLPPVSGGGYFTGTKPDIMLTEIHRQARGNPIIDLATLAREGNPINLGTYGLSRVVSRGDVTTGDVVSADILIVGKNQTRRQFNRSVREIKGHSSPVPEVGEKLICLKNARDRGMFNGSMWEVNKVSPAKRSKIQESTVKMSVTSLDIDMDAPIKIAVRYEFFTGNETDIPWRERAQSDEFDFGYAITAHKSQGSQWGDVYLFDESKAFRDSANRWLYTAITRASERITIVI